MAGLTSDAASLAVGVLQKGGDDAYARGRRKAGQFTGAADKVLEGLETLRLEDREDTAMDATRQHQIDMQDDRQVHANELSEAGWNRADTRAEKSSQDAASRQERSLDAMEERAAEAARRVKEAETREEFRRQRQNASDLAALAAGAAGKDPMAAAGQRTAAAGFASEAAGMGMQMAGVAPGAAQGLPSGGSLAPPPSPRAARDAYDRQASFVQGEQKKLEDQVLQWNWVDPKGTGQKYAVPPTYDEAVAIHAKLTGDKSGELPTKLANLLIKEQVKYAQQDRMRKQNADKPQDQPITLPNGVVLNPSDLGYKEAKAGYGKKLAAEAYGDDEGNLTVEEELELSNLKNVNNAFMRAITEEQVERGGKLSDYAQKRMDKLTTGQSESAKRLVELLKKKEGKTGETPLLDQLGDRQALVVPAWKAEFDAMTPAEKKKFLMDATPDERAKVGK